MLIKSIVDSCQIKRKSCRKTLTLGVFNAPHFKGNMPQVIWSSSDLITLNKFLFFLNLHLRVDNWTKSVFNFPTLNILKLQNYWNCNSTSVSVQTAQILLIRDSLDFVPASLYTPSCSLNIIQSHMAAGQKSHLALSDKVKMCPAAGRIVQQ